MRKKFRAAWILASRHCIEWSWLPKCGLQDTCASVVRRQVQWYAYMMTAGCDQHQAVLTHPRSHSLILPVVCCGLSLTVLSFWLPEAVSFPFHSSSSCPNPGLMYDFSNPVIQLAQQASSVDLENQVPFSWWKLLFGNSFHHWHCSFPFSSLCSWCKHSTEDCASSFSQALVLLWECYWLW